MPVNDIETKLAQLGNRTDKKTGAINLPIYLSTAFEHQGLGLSTGYGMIILGQKTLPVPF